jgi:hypothetical protein
MRTLLLLLCWSIWSIAMAAPCPPIATVTGDKVEAETVAALLNKRNITSATVEGCPSTKVRIIRVGKQLLLEIEDSLGRNSRRLVSTYKAAANVIESWVYDTLDPVSFDDLLPKEPKKINSAASLPIEPKPEIIQPIRELPVLVLPTLPAISLTTQAIDVSLFSELTIMRGGSLWLGFAARATRHVGPLSISVLGRYMVRGDQFPSAGSGQSIDASQCEPVDENNDGINEFLRCEGGCIFLDNDGDGLLDDKQCQSNDASCTTLDINNDNIIDDFQCESTPSCFEPVCLGQPPFQAFRSASGLQLELGVPIQHRELLLTPGLALGTTNFFSGGAFSPARSGLAEASFVVSRSVNNQLRLDARISAALSPGVSSNEGQWNTRLSVGFHR